MPSGHSKKKSHQTVNATGNFEHSKNQGRKSKSIIGLTDASHRKRYNENGNLSTIDTSIITSKRLTIGVKGIFGNARNSNSVYREMQRKLEKRKLSKEVTSEIEQNLSRIFPNKKKCSCNSNKTPATSAGGDTVFQTPCSGADPCLSTPHLTNTGKRTPFSSSMRRPSSTGSDSTATATVSNCSAHTTTPVFKDEFSRVASTIVTSIPSLKIVKDNDLLESTRSELRLIEKETHELNIISKFEPEDSQSSQEEAPALKKHCVEEERGEPMQMEVGEINPTIISIEENLQKDFQCSEKTSLFPAKVFEEPEGRDQHAIKDHIVEPMEIASVESGQASFPFRRHYEVLPPSSRLFSTEDDNNFSSTTTRSDLFMDNRSLLQNARSILQQPISSLRRNRRSTSIRSLNSVTDYPHRQTSDGASMDILDYIDNIPIKDLESELLHQKSETLTSAPPSLIQRPPIQSPSPPKMYRMNMF